MHSVAMITHKTGIGLTLWWWWATIFGLAGGRIETK
jgi:hypothetical protein